MRYRKLAALVLILFVGMAAFPAQARAGRCEQTPVASDDRAILFRPRTLVIVDVLHNDYDPGGCPFKIKSFSRGERAATRFYGYGAKQILYDYQGLIMPLTDHFTYTIENSAGKTATATVNVLLYPVDLRPPIAVDDTASAYPYYFQEVNVLHNDADPDAANTGLGMHVESIDFDRSRGAAYIYKYSPESIGLRPYKPGPMVITYTVRSGATGLTSTGKLTVNIRERIKPIANDDFATTRPGQEVAIDVLKNDVLPDRVDRHIGLLLLGLDAERNDQLRGKFRFSYGRILYTPELDASGTFVFYYRVRAGYMGAVSSGKVTVNIQR
jgi:Bacterial Ig domain